jgi:hypothetical protein
MKHVLFAEFPDPTTARTALGQLSEAGVRPSRCNVNLHNSDNVEHNDERPMNETNARSGILLGLIAAAFVGALMGWLVTGPLALFEVGIGTGIFTGIALGVAIGFVGGALTGAMNPHRKLEKLERVASREGGVVATVEVEGVKDEESVRRVFEAHGARIESRTL